MSEINRNMRKMFTEKQIEEIAKSSVSGGTKLYSHDIIFEDEDENEIEVILISSVSVEYDTPDSISEDAFLPFSFSQNINGDESVILSICGGSDGVQLVIISLVSRDIHLILLDSIVSDSVSTL